jgi:hypothetical protein
MRVLKGASNLTRVSRGDRGRYGLPHGESCKLPLIELAPRRSHARSKACDRS